MQGVARLFRRPSPDQQPAPSSGFVRDRRSAFWLRRAHSPHLHHALLNPQLKTSVQFHPPACSGRTSLHAQIEHSSTSPSFG
jgi:hypothetical protein